MPLVAEFDGAPPGWDKFAEAQAGFTHFHRHRWKAVIEGVFGHRCRWLAATDGGELVGVLPLVTVRTPLFGHYLVSMPFLNYGGPIGSPEAVRALAGQASELARSEGARLLELRSRVPLDVDLPVSHRKVTVVMDLPAGGPDEVMAAFPAKLRSQVRRPDKAGVEYRFGPDQVAPFFDVFSRHMRDLGTPTQPRRLFEAIQAAFGDDAWFGCAWLDGRPVAGGAGFRWRNEFEMTWASALAEHSRVSANMGLYFAFMARAQADGCTVFNFGRCTPGGGTHRFKRQWGGRDEPLHWYQWTPEGAVGAGTPSPEQGAYAWGPKLWRKLPVPVATALGPHIVRGIP